MPQQIPTFTSLVHSPKVTGQHARASVSAAATLGSLVTIPTIIQGATAPARKPDVVTLQVETGGGAVYYTVDGTTPSATNGFLVPTAPAQLQLPYPDHLANTGAASATNQQIQLFASAATNVQCLFEWWTL